MENGFHQSLTLSQLRQCISEKRFASLLPRNTGSTVITIVTGIVSGYGYTGTAHARQRFVRRPFD